MNSDMTTYQKSVAMHLDICAAQYRSRVWRLEDLLDAATYELTWDEVVRAIYKATGLSVTVPTLRSWKKRQTLEEKLLEKAGK